MNSFIVGFILGIVVSTVGLTGVAKLFDNGVHKVQDVAKSVTNE